MKRSCIFLLLFASLLLVAFPTQVVVAREPITFVSLGDSIPNGYGLTDQELAYPALLVQRMDANGIFLSRDGITSGGILSALRSGSYTQALADADVVTLSVGGNDFLSNLNFDAFFSFLQGDTSKLQEIANVGVEALSENFPKIVEKIKELSPNAILILQTVYNPYMAFSTVAAGNTVFSDYVDTQIQRLNAIITSYAEEERGIYLCDVYKAFSTSADMTLVNATPDPLMIDPHPSLRGHQCIADTMWQLFTALDIADEDGLGDFLKPLDKVEDPPQDLPQDAPQAPQGNPIQPPRDEIEPKPHNETKDSNAAFWYILLSIALVAGGVLCLFLKRKVK